MLSWENSHVEFSTLDSVIKVMRASEYIFVFESPIVLTLPPSPPLWIWSIYVIWYTYLLSIYSQFFQRKFSFSIYILFPASHLVIKRGCFFFDVIALERAAKIVKIYISLTARFMKTVHLIFLRDIFKKSDLLLLIWKVLPREKFYPEKKSTPEKVYPGKSPQFLFNLFETWWKYLSL